jgi:hypothetical protein
MASIEEIKNGVARFGSETDQQTVYGHVYKPDDALFDCGYGVTYA